jgi:hypothetical protein
MNLTNPINVTNAVQKLILPPAPMMQDQNNRPTLISALPETVSGRANYWVFLKTSNDA